MLNAGGLLNPKTAKIPCKTLNLQTIRNKVPGWEFAVVPGGSCCRRSGRIVKLRLGEIRAISLDLGPSWELPKIGDPNIVP